MKKILIVDDNKLNLIAAKNVLNDIYTVTAVTKGEQVFTFLEKQTCDLILLDINMPGMDGFEVLEELKKNEAGKDIPVIFLTADNDAATESRCFNSGAIDFIAKLLSFLKRQYIILSEELTFPQSIPVSSLW